MIAHDRVSVAVAEYVPVFVCLCLWFCLRACDMRTPIWQRYPQRSLQFLTTEVQFIFKHLELLDGRQLRFVFVDGK